MADGTSYEEVRRQRVEENSKHLEGLGIAKISKSLLEVAKNEYKLLKYGSSPKFKKNLEIVEPRRSTRARNPVPTYRDEVDFTDIRLHRRRYTRTGHSGREYYGRIASSEEQLRALKTAEELQSKLKSGNPSFVKAMVRSHVSSCFWLGLPSKFCKECLPLKDLNMVLEDEHGAEYDAIYIGSRTGLSGGWRAFAMDHNLEDGDVLVFELSQPDRFKIYIIKACEEPSLDNDATNVDADVKGNSRAAKRVESINSTLSPDSQKLSQPGSLKRAKKMAKTKK